MRTAADRLLAQYEDGQISRRNLLLSLSALMAAPAAAVQTVSQTSQAPLAVQSLNHVTLSVSDIPRSIDFYQSLFGMPIFSRQANGANLAIDSGPSSGPPSSGRPFIGIFGGGGQVGVIHHFALGLKGFERDRIVGVLEEHGVEARVRMRDDVTAEIYFSDPDGIQVQLQDASYCGGDGVLGNDCG